MDGPVRKWLERLLTDAGAGADAPRLAFEIAPQVAEALKASGLDVLRQCSIAQFGEADDSDIVKDWTVSVNEAVAAAIRRLENQRQKT